MALTYELIEARTLGSATQSVTFSSIPQTFTDLNFRMSFRTTFNGATTVLLRYNGVSTTTYSNRYLTADGINLFTGGAANNNAIEWYSQQSSASPSGTRCNGEIYIPSYTTSFQKPTWIMQVAEINTAADGYTSVNAGIAYTTSAISSLSIIAFGASYDFTAGSQFYLYGIKNS